MLIILALLAASFTAPIDSAESGLDKLAMANVHGTVTVPAGSIATIRVYNSANELIEEDEYYFTTTYGYDLGYYDDNNDTDRWKISCVWNDGTPPYPVDIHYFAFPDHFVFSGLYKCWLHVYNF